MIPKFRFFRVVFGKVKRIATEPNVEEARISPLFPGCLLWVACCALTGDLFLHREEKSLVSRRCQEVSLSAGHAFDFRRLYIPSSKPSLPLRHFMFLCKMPWIPDRKLGVNTSQLLSNNAPRCLALYLIIHSRMGFRRVHWNVVFISKLAVLLSMGCGTGLNKYL